jgi:hypothetical protein
LETFKEFLIPIINEIHGPLSISYNEIELNKEVLNELINIEYQNVEYAYLEYSRCIQGFPFPYIASNKIKSDIEKTIKLALNNLEKENLLEQIEVFNYNQDKLIFSHILNEHHVQLKGRIITCHSSYEDHLTLITTKDRKVLIIINDSAHLRIIFNTNHTPFSIKETYERSERFLDNLSSKIKFVNDKLFGFINPDLSIIGQGVEFFGLIKANNHFNEKIGEHLSCSYLEKREHLQFSLKGKLLETKLEFLKRINNRLYNLTYILDGNTPEIQRSQSLDKAPEDLKFAYENSFESYKYTHLCPNNITLNKVLDDNLILNNSVSYFKQFPLFYQFYLIKSKDYPADHNLNKIYIQKIEKLFVITQHDLEKINKIEFSKVKSLDFIIRRNLRGFEFNPHLNEADKTSLLHTLTGYSNYMETILKEEYRQFIKLHLDMSDHLVFEVKLSKKDCEERKDISHIIQAFFDVYDGITKKMEFEKLYYEKDNNFGYLTNNIHFLGFGLSFSIRIDNSHEEVIKLSDLEEKEGFSLELREDKKDVLLRCVPTLNTSLTRILEVISELFHFIKIQENI